MPDAANRCQVLSVTASAGSRYQVTEAGSVIVMTNTTITNSPVLEAVPRLRPDSAPPWRALPVLLVGAFLPVLDAFIVNVALATIGRTLHTGAAELELTVSAYGVA